MNQSVTKKLNGKSIWIWNTLCRIYSALTLCRTLNTFGELPCYGTPWVTQSPCSITAMYGHFRLSNVTLKVTSATENTLLYSYFLKDQIDVIKASGFFSTSKTIYWHSVKRVSLDPRERNEPHKIINIFTFHLLMPLSMEVFIQPP